MVVPLKTGALAGVRELVAEGAPFDPSRTALTQHQLLLTEQEAIFVFETQSEEGLADLLGQLDILAAAVAWRDLVAGPPRLASVAYVWERPEPRVGSGCRARVLDQAVPSHSRSAANPQRVCALPLMGSRAYRPTVESRNTTKEARD